jgi:hypothetical protein
MRLFELTVKRRLISYTAHALSLFLFFTLHSPFLDRSEDICLAPASPERVQTPGALSLTPFSQAIRTGKYP